VKYKILSAVIATALLAGCNNDSSTESTFTETQSQDGYIYNGIMTAVCDDKTYAAYTDKEGKAAFDDTKVTAETCTFTVKNNGNLTRDMDATNVPWYGTMTTPTGQVKVNPFTSLLATMMMEDDTLTLESAFADLKSGIDSNDKFTGFTLENILSDFSASGQDVATKELAVLANTVHQTNTQLASDELTIAEQFAILEDVVDVTNDAVSDPDNLDKIIPIDISSTGAVTAETPVDKVTDESELPDVPTTPAPTGTGGGDDETDT
jgi:hypothetical protein